MALSNTAVPTYYGRFRDAVVGGAIPVCQEISMEMNRIDKLIDNPGVYYDSEAVEGYIRFCENELTLTDGSDLKLLDTFKLWAEEIFGWYYFIQRSVFVPSQDGRGGKYVQKYIKKRLTTKQYLKVARGAAKSFYVSTVHDYFLNVDTSTTYQIAVAPTLKQADEVISPIRTAIARSRGPFFKFLTQGSVHSTSGPMADHVKLASTKRGIENFLTGSCLEARPMSIEKLQGIRPKISDVDEWASCNINEDVIGAIEQGASKLDDYLIMAVSSEGTIRNGVGDTINIELYKILRGEYINPRTSIWIYKLDSLDEINKPSYWIKANPNIAAMDKYEAYEEDVERMEKAPASRNDIIAKRFGIPVEGYTYFFTYEETLAEEKKSCYWGLPCSLGADLSQGNDFCAFTFLFPLENGHFGIKVRSYISSSTFECLSAAARNKYEEFRREGSLIILDGTILDMDEVYDDLDDHVSKSKYDIRSFGFDPYNAKEFVERFIRENGEFGLEKVIQGAKTESVPLGELKKLSEGHLLHFDELLMQFSMANAIVLTDTNFNMKLSKKQYKDKIDNVSALLDAFIAFKSHKDAFK